MENELDALKRTLEAKYQRPIDKDIVLMIAENQSLYQKVAEASEKINTSQKVLQFQSDSQAFAFAFGKWGIYAIMFLLLIMSAWIAYTYHDSDLRKFTVLEQEGVRYIQLERADGKWFTVGRNYVVKENGKIIVPLNSKE